ncbi:hypothetical protein DXG03_007414 [Asterophora parasitica]|uniref:Sodium/calcium exchanger membrane region domain-containing protein n=1 Tax=Asterophora parasitica TaxID=117018 RepID=A0A9P7G6W4_9AGAR|nr:hypothetical protein DXG03_007414 [Asterophora parasitica]
MEANGTSHRQRALELLTRYATAGSKSNRPRSSIATSGHGVEGSGHSIWSDHARNTRHITIQGGVDSLFNHVDLGHPSIPAPAYMARPFSVNLTGPNNNVEVLWSARDADAESQYSTETATETPPGRLARLSRVFAKPFSAWQKFNGEGRAKIGWVASLMAFIRLKLLQSTITGIVLLRLLLVPGFSFLTGGVGVLTQDLHPHIVQMNNTLLTIGALTLLLPAAYFSALDRTVPAGIINVGPAVSDGVRGDFLKLSRGLAVFLLIIYVSARVYLHKPPGKTESLHDHPNAPASFKADVKKLEEEEPELNPWFCVIMLLVAVVMLGVTAEFLAGSVNPLRQLSGIRQEWFGIFLLPLVSFSADGVLSTFYFFRRHIRNNRGYPQNDHPSCTELAQGRSIDLGIQFLLFWMPVLVLLAWFSHKPLSLLFDVFEVAVLLGACFLVTYVTADSKTNWAEGLMMVTFYLMIATTVWFYPGQTDVMHMLSCVSVEASLNAPPRDFRTGQKPLGARPSVVKPRASNPDMNSRNAEMKILNARLQKLLDLHDVLEKRWPESF